MEPLLEAKSLSRRFYKGQQLFTAVDQVSLSVSPGEALGVVGESGSGKTTLIKMITGLLKPDSGRIYLNGRDVTDARGAAARQRRRAMQLVFQTPQASFDPRQTLGRGILEGMVNNGVPKAQARDRLPQLLEQCGLSADFARRYPHQVSGGQCQRAAIARAVAVEPQLLICDEATSSLDVTVQAQVMDLLETLRRSGTAFLFISHDLALVQQFCSRVLVLRHGRVEESGPMDQVLLHPRSEYTRQLLDAAL